jgi:hypothetical protein
MITILESKVLVGAVLADRVEVVNYIVRKVVVNVDNINNCVILLRLYSLQDVVTVVHFREVNLVL